MSSLFSGEAGQAGQGGHPVRPSLRGPRMISPLPLASAAQRLRGKPGRPPRTRPAEGAPAVQASAPRSSPVNTQGYEAAVPVVCPRLLDVRAAAAYLGVSTWTIRDLDAGGRLPRVRLPLAGDRELRRLLFDVRDLDALVEAAKEACSGR